ncbi:hypothetical protein A2U01_0047404 [Trifolium medium]|uniref:Uncharacterized protein n=1 Tax=Trifolium medium TaxID=97028 RepID=A0A392QQG7_9FABA|nr:hypothetical protein [Trifolium medium]
MWNHHSGFEEGVVKASRAARWLEKIGVVAVVGARRGRLGREALV